MTDARERPEYGEYATPEEQAEAMGTPTAPFVEAAIVEPEALADAAAAVTRPQPRRWDLVLTIALIVVARPATWSRTGLWKITGCAVRTEERVRLALTWKNLITRLRTRTVFPALTLSPRFQPRVTVLKLL